MSVKTHLKKRDAAATQLLHVLRFGGALVPVVATLYGLGIYFELFPGSVYYSDLAFIVISAIFLSVGLLQFIYNTSNPASALRIIEYHMLAAGYLLFIAGFQSPLIGFWVLLVVVGFLYFGSRAVAASIATLFLLALFDGVLASAGSSVVLGNLVSASVVSFIGLFIIYLTRVYLVQHGAIQRTKAREELAQSRVTTLINSINDAIINTDARGNIHIYNAASLGLLDTNASLSGRHFDEVLSLRDGKGEPVCYSALTAHDSGAISREDLYYNFASGERIRLAISGAPVPISYGDVHASGGYIFIIRDITKSKTLEEERDEFISVISHELRTPLTIAEGALSNAALLMQRGATQKVLSATVNEAHDQVVFLAGLVNDLSTLSRAERGVADSAEAIDACELAHHLYREYQPQAAAKKLHFNLDIAGDVGILHISKLYLEEILQNFITNAIKYTATGSVSLHIKHASGGVEFAVTDTGIGISKSDKTKVFDKFFRSEDYRTRETSGTGLGLYVVHKLAAKLGATIELKSRLNHGSTFSFIIAQPAKSSKK